MTAELTTHASPTDHLPPQRCLLCQKSLQNFDVEWKEKLDEGVKRGSKVCHPSRFHWLDESKLLRDFVTLVISQPGVRAKDTARRR